MDRTKFAETVKRLEEVDAVIKKLDPAIRSDAFALLKGYVAGSRISVDLSEDDNDDDLHGKEQKPKRHRPGGTLDTDALIDEFESDKDSENALLALAIYYARHGRGPFKMSALKAVADDLAITVPKRLDMTFKQARRGGKEVLRQQADGWKVTPSGETWLKATYRVTRGKTSAVDDSS